jgi:hypothetical protein
MDLIFYTTFGVPKWAVNRKDRRGNRKVSQRKFSLRDFAILGGAVKKI